MNEKETYQAVLDVYKEFYAECCRHINCTDCKYFEYADMKDCFLKYCEDKIKEIEETC